MTSTTGADIKIHNTLMVTLNTRFECRLCNAEFKSALHLERHCKTCVAGGRVHSHALIYVINPEDMLLKAVRQVPVNSSMKKRHTAAQLSVTRYGK